MRILKLNGSRAHLHLSSVGGSRAHLERTNGAQSQLQHGQPQLCMSWFFGPWNTANLHSYKLIKQQFSLQHHRPGLLQTIGIFSLSKIISTTIKIKDFYLKMTFHTFSDWKLLKMSHLNFWILAFSPIFVLFKVTCLVTLIDRKVFKNSPKLIIFWHF